LGGASTNGYCVAVGDSALSSVNAGFNTGVGQSAGSSLTSGTYNTCLGYNAQASSATAIGDFTLGDSNVASLRCNDTSISTLSDARDKKDVVDSPYGLDTLKKVRPVKFEWDTRKGNIKDGRTDLGFIAQELYALEENNIAHLATKSNDGELYEAKYSNLIPIMAQAIKELSAKVEELEKKGTK
jgi:hypothetical protein